ncbi:carbon-nitrogen hydrolase family protein [Parahaliea mediterranea]|uniref:Carbon-nitrogen hydrolase family protein n=1 Tax=Parahaliea mediterranea TaxID=651086 RepID=A0A939ILU8_9GAMM|nr:carbon-nitrogen hydrolase family protein [Parahaliea mediterranea]MBN7796337.1 carbon-nitrogen hydrolase family protein [Parahaliea mediterranea]
MSHFAIAALQLELSGRDNRYLIEKEIRKVRSRFPWVQMVVLGELASYGADTINAQELPGEAEPFYAELARDTGLWLVPGSIYEREELRVYNTALVFNPQGETVGRYRKQFPFCPYEKGVWPGEDFLVFDVPDVGRFGVSICYDQWFPETTRNLAWLGAEVILCPTMTNTVDREQELCLARANAISNQCYFFNINVAGDLGNGRSIIVGPDGQVIHQAGERDEIMPVEVDLGLVRRVRERGVHGLGQPLKSFRDSTVAFPAYAPGARAEGPLAQLGELATPNREELD